MQTNGAESVISRPTQVMLLALLSVLAAGDTHLPLTDGGRVAAMAGGAVEALLSAVSLVSSRLSPRPPRSLFA